MKSSNKMSLLSKIILIILPVFTILCCLCIGRMNVSVVEVLLSIKAHIFGGNVLSNQMERVLWSIRLPRILLAFLAGAGLSAAGCTFQSLFNNPLATPDTLGVASGASFGAALGLLLGFELIGVQFVSLFFGILAVVLTVLSGKTKAKSALSNVVLAGIMIGSLFSALISLVKFTADVESELPEITYWLMGNLSAANYKSLLLGSPIIIIGITILLLMRWRLNILPLSEEEARATGVNINLLRIVCVLCSNGITASCVSMCGQVGWVGLLIPHMCRMLFGNNHLSLMPTSVILGGTFLVIVDTLARSVSAAEIPISVLTAIIGAPFFITLMRRSEGWQL